MWQRGEETRCGQCPKPPLFAENADAFALFSHSQTQFEHGFSGPTRLVYSEVRLVAETLGFDFKKEFPKLQVIEREYLAIVAEQANKNRVNYE
jgi:hypothetical protein